jgi:hypothetical protein
MFVPYKNDVPETGFTERRIRRAPSLDIHFPVAGPHRLASRRGDHRRGHGPADSGGVLGGTGGHRAGRSTGSDPT